MEENNQDFGFFIGPTPEEANDLMGRVKKSFSDLAAAAVGVDFGLNDECCDDPDINIYEPSSIILYGREEVGVIDVEAKRSE